LLQQLFEAWR